MKCWLATKILTRDDIEHDRRCGWREAELYATAERVIVINKDGNQLISGLTQSFMQRLIDRGWLRMEPPE